MKINFIFRMLCLEPVESLLYFINGPFRPLFSLYFRLFNTVDSKQFLAPKEGFVVLVLKVLCSYPCRKPSFMSLVGLEN